MSIDGMTNHCAICGKGTESQNMFYMKSKNNGSNWLLCSKKCVGQFLIHERIIRSQNASKSLEGKEITLPPSAKKKEETK